MRRANGLRRGATAAGALLAVGLVAGAVLGGAGTASAHDYLVSTSPAADSTVSEALSEVSLTFNEPPLADASAAIAIEVHDPSGANVASGAVSIVNSTLSIDVAPTVHGAYTVLWQNVSADGHAVSGQFGFAYAGPSAEGDAGGSGGDVVATPEPSSSATAGPVPSATASGTRSATAADGNGGGIQLPLVLVGVGTALAVVVIVALILTIALRRRRRSGD